MGVAAVQGVPRGCGMRKSGGQETGIFGATPIVYIYALSEPSGEIRYIGKSVEPWQRLYMHIWAAKQGRSTHAARWIKKMLDHGQKPLMSILAIVPESTWQQHERAYIAEYLRRKARLVNITAGGDGVNALRTAVWKKRIGDAHRGRTHSQETKDRLSRLNTKTHCKWGHLLAGENVRLVTRTKNGNTHKECRVCRREWQREERLRRGIVPRTKYLPLHQEFCKRGHPLSGENLRLLKRARTLERICRECVRIRNRAAKARARGRRCD